MLFSTVMRPRIISRLSAIKRNHSTCSLNEIKKTKFELMAFRKDGEDSIGYWRSDLSKIVDLKPIAKNIGLDVSYMFDLRYLLGHQQVFIEILKEAQTTEKFLLLEHDIDQSPILSKFSKIIGVARNFKDIKVSNSPPKHPIIFIKPPNTIIGPNESTRLPEYPLKTMCEAELAIVIGCQAKDVTIADAAEYIFGFAAVNDITDKSDYFDCQKYPLTHGKYMDGYLPCASRILVNRCYDFGNKQVSSYKNGVLTQSQSTKDMIFTIPELISRISCLITLEPGDCILTGTPSYLLEPEENYLENGDVVHVEVEDLLPITTLILSRNGTKA